MFKNDQMWTLVYKIAGKSTLKSSQADNIAALNKPLSDNDTGKLSDTSIKQLCGGQYLIKQENTETESFGGWLYCHFDDISKYGDAKRSSKHCSSGFSDNPSEYSISVKAADYAYGFSSQEKSSGSIIVQGNYGNSGKKGSIKQKGASVAAAVCTTTGGCQTTVWCLPAHVNSAMPLPFQRYDKKVKECRFCAGHVDTKGKVCCLSRCW